MSNIIVITRASARRCRQCHQPISASRPKSKYCSKACSTKHWQRTPKGRKANRLTCTRYDTSEHGKVVCRRGKANRRVSYLRFINVYKTYSGCERCRRLDLPASKLHCQHFGEKRLYLSNGHLHPLREVVNELLRCKVLCATCHRVVHAELRRCERLAAA